MKIQIVKTMSKAEIEHATQSSVFVRNYTKTLREQGIVFEVAKVEDIKRKENN